MTDIFSDFTKDLLIGLQESADFINGQPTTAKSTVHTCADAKAIREQLGMSQSQFCQTYGIPLNTLQNWEQRRSNPDRTASAYLWAIADLPSVIGEAQLRRRAITPESESVQL